jgi:hypothetical protein
MNENWFEALFGFEEHHPMIQRHDWIHKNIELRNEDNNQGQIYSKINQKSYQFGKLEVPALADLRKQVQLILPSLPSQNHKVSEVVGDIQKFHQADENQHAVFQVASQFNLLEMIGPRVCPEDGISNYVHDHTQGPSCAISAAAGTLYRNYFVNVNALHTQNNQSSNTLHPIQRRGQTKTNQIHTLANLEKALDVKLKRQNGYVFASEDQLIQISNTIQKQSPTQREVLMGHLEVGIQWDTQVTLTKTKNFVQQVYCSALPISYQPIRDLDLWEDFACLVLDAAYEATLLTGILNKAKTGSSKIYLTTLGGGAFGNEEEWIHSAIEKTIAKIPKVGLDINIVSYLSPKPIIQKMIQRILTQIS